MLAETRNVFFVSFLSWKLNWIDRHTLSNDLMILTNQILTLKRIQTMFKFSHLKSPWNKTKPMVFIC